MIEELRNERIKQQEHHFFLERLINATPIGIVILDLDDRIDMINPAAQKILRLTSNEAAGRLLEDFTEVPVRDLEAMKSGETRIIGINGIQTYKCRKSHFVDRGFHRNFILIEELTREIMETQKRAYEKVIRMMSHEINNSVGAVNSILDSSLHYRTQLATDDRKDFESAVKAAIERNRGLNTFMANFADVVRIPPPSKHRYDLHRLLESVHVLMSAECEKRAIDWKWQLASKPMMVRIDPQQMEQVLVNIVKNSVEAIDNNGSISVLTDSRPPMLHIIDTGKGITPEQRSHLFTPFYSTKRNGQGIGLTLIREILINHHFNFNLESRGSGHTEFWIKFTS
jgi:nitrogen fixation/metabolism regulation signal transduction histidine kinase